MSLARQTRDHVLSLITASAPAEGGGFTPGRLHEEEGPYTPAATVAAQQTMMRLTHDLRQLKDTKAIDRKIAAKRLMLPEYAAWVDGQLAAGRATEARELPVTIANDVLPTMMVWAIDVGDWPRALELASHVLRFDVALPARYIGLLGSRRKTILIARLLRDEGVSEERLRAVHAPIGLDLGGRTPAEIALAVLAEITQERYGGTGRALRLSDDLYAKAVART